MKERVKAQAEVSLKILTGSLERYATDLEEIMTAMEVTHTEHELAIDRQYQAIVAATTGLRYINENIFKQLNR